MRGSEIPPLEIVYYSSQLGRYNIMASDRPTLHKLKPEVALQIPATDQTNQQETADE
ncbi:MAG TPA: hypothetical protein VJR48_15920 [Ktedonobacterales bacterium]|nr:hypothetical protein [Ktedonobacterales bacterium]